MKRMVLIVSLLLFAMSSVIAQIYETHKMVYKLHGQTRRYQMTWTSQEDGGIRLDWEIERNLKMQTGTFWITKQAVEQGNALSWTMPVDGQVLTLPATDTYNFISRSAYRQLKESGSFVYNGETYRKVDESSVTPSFSVAVIAVRGEKEGALIWIRDDEKMPLIVKMANNPVEIDWTAE